MSHEAPAAAMDPLEILASLQQQADLSPGSSVSSHTGSPFMYMAGSVFPSGSPNPTGSPYITGSPNPTGSPYTAGFTTGSTRPKVYLAPGQTTFGPGGASFHPAEPITFPRQRIVLNGIQATRPVAMETVAKVKDEDGELKPSDFTHFANNSTLHGLNKVFPEDGDGITVQRALWLAVVTAMMGLFLYWSITHILVYFSYPAVTHIDEGDESQFFPAVTFCNVNKYRLSALTNQDFYHLGRSLGYLHPNRSLKAPRNRDLDYNRLEAIQRLADFSQLGNVTNGSLTELQNRTGHQLTDIVKKCKFRGRPCCVDMFTTVFTRYGKCYTFNSGSPNQPVLKTLKGGIGNGVEFFLDVQQEDYMPAWGESDEVTFEVGFKIQLHTQEEPPFIHELGFGVGPGMQYYVSTQEQRITYLPAPWGQCKAENDLTFDFAKYTTSACRIDCETKFVVSQCGCKMVHMPGNFPICTPDIYVECADQALDFLVKSDNKKCVCDTPCNTTRYNLFMSHVKFPSEQAVKYLARKYGKPEDYFRKNTLVLNVFFEALNYETIEQQKAYEVASLLGDIGGQMGLFIGASILTILELFDYLYEVLKDKCTERRHQPRSESNAVSVNLEDCKRDNSRAPLS
ncbi:acid-sensing ion channel 2-like isoform X6 [Branchiostoma floridae x Branchiostoma belcheri]